MVMVPVLVFSITAGGVELDLIFHLTVATSISFFNVTATTEIYTLSLHDALPISAFLRKYRKHSIVGVLILSALITPPDFISQVIVSIPIILLYEVGILVSARVEKRRLKREQVG